MTPVDTLSVRAEEATEISTEAYLLDNEGAVEDTAEEVVTEGIVTGAALDEITPDAADEEDEEDIYDAAYNIWLGNDAGWLTVKFYEENPDNEEELIYMGDLTKYPYWKNDLDHEGKLIPADAETYNLYCDIDKSELHLKDLNLIVGGETCKEYEIALYCEWPELNIVLEGDNYIGGHDQGINMFSGDLKFSGSGNLTVESFCKKEDRTAMSVQGSITHAGTGTVTMEPSANSTFDIWGYYDEVEITNGGKFIRPTYVYRVDYVDGADRMGFAGCYYSEAEYDNGNAIYSYQEGKSGIDTELYWVHGETMQEVVDKLSGKIDTRFYDGAGKLLTDEAGTAITTKELSKKYKYIEINTSASNYILNEASFGDQYLTDTSSFDGIYISGEYDYQATNHDLLDGVYISDTVYSLTADGKDVLNKIKSSGILESLEVDDEDKAITTDLSDVNYISYYNGVIYTAVPADATKDSPYSYNLGSRIISYDALWDAIAQYNGGSAEDSQLSIDSIIYSENAVFMGAPYKTLHINAGCDVRIYGSFDEADTNIYFGSLSGEEHTLSIMNQNVKYTELKGLAQTSASDEVNIIKKSDNYTRLSCLSYWEENINVYLYKSAVSTAASGDYAATVSNISAADVLSDAAVTADQLKALESQAGVTAELSVNKSDGAAAAADVQSVLKANNISCSDPLYMDLSLVADIKSNGASLGFGEGSGAKELTELSSPAKVTITLPENYRSADRTYYVVRRHTDSAGTVQTDLISDVAYDSSKGTITFNTDKFSEYAVAYTDKTQTPTPTAGTTPDVTVYYKTHIQSKGWETTWKTNGITSGTSGQAKRLEGIEIKVSGNDNLGIQYTTHCQSYGWLGWASNGESAGTSGQSKRLEAIQIILVPKGSAAPSASYGGVTSTQAKAYIAK